MMKTITQMNYQRFWLILVLIIGTFTNCYYQNKEDLGIGQEPCDILEATYANHIVPILEAECLNCHQPGNEQGGIDLLGYDKVLESVLDGAFLGSIIQEPNYSPMPPNGKKLSNCEIETIELWIQNGALDN